jgi:hypothetical protein
MHVSPAAEPEMIDREARLAKSREVLQLAVNNPSRTPEAVHASMVEVARDLDVKDIERFLPAPPPPAPPPDIPPFEENAMMLAGTKYPDPLPGQNHGAHIIAHQNFVTERDGSLYKAMTKEGRDMLDQHIRAHMAFEYQLQHGVRPNGQFGPPLGVPAAAAGAGGATGLVPQPGGPAVPVPGGGAPGA